MNKSNITSSFGGVWSGLCFLIPFSFYYHCQLVKGQFHQKSGGGRSTPPPSPDPLPPIAMPSFYFEIGIWYDIWINIIFKLLFEVNGTCVLFAHFFYLLFIYSWMKKYQSNNSQKQSFLTAENDAFQSHYDLFQV